MFKWKCSNFVWNLWLLLKDPCHVWGPLANFPIISIDFPFTIVKMKQPRCQNFIFPPKKYFFETEITVWKRTILGGKSSMYDDKPSHVWVALANSPLKIIYLPFTVVKMKHPRCQNFIFPPTNFYFLIEISVWKRTILGGKSLNCNDKPDD